MVRAMVLAGAEDTQSAGARRLVTAGPPAGAFANTGLLRGEEGGLLGVVDASTGHRVSQMSIDAPPVFDGMCAARGRIVLSLTSGTIIAFE
jgi:hypothetical protein